MSTRMIRRSNVRAEQKRYIQYDNYDRLYENPYLRYKDTSGTIQSVNALEGTCGFVHGDMITNHLTGWESFTMFLGCVHTRDTTFAAIVCMRTDEIVLFHKDNMKYVVMHIPTEVLPRERITQIYL